MSEGTEGLGQLLVWLAKKKDEGNKVCGCIWSLLKLAVLAVLVIIIGGIIGAKAGWW